MPNDFDSWLADIQKDQPGTADVHVAGAHWAAPTKRKARKPRTFSEFLKAGYDPGEDRDEQGRWAGAGIPSEGYHGSPHNGLTSISSRPPGRQFDNATSQFGAFVSPDRAGAVRYAGEKGTIYQVSHGIKNVYEMPWREFSYYQSPHLDADGKAALSNIQTRAGELAEEARARRAALEARGFDGIVVRNSKGVPIEMASFKDIPITRGQKMATFSDCLALIVSKGFEIPLSQANGSLYVRRNLLNAADLHAWAKGAGIPNVVPPEQMHVTQVYSRDPVAMQPRTDQLTAAGGARRLAPLGDKGAVVMHFENDQLQRRWQESRDAGASWDHEGGYKPHVTLTYDAGGADIDGISPPSFPLQFGPEIHEPLNENWAEDNGLRVMAKIAKADNDKHLAYGWASVIEERGRTIFDSQADSIDVDTLVAAAHDCMKNWRAGGEMHLRSGTADVGTIVESLVFTREVQKALGIDLGKVGWLIGIHVADPAVWQLVKSGVYPAFSIGGSAERIAV